MADVQKIQKVADRVAAAKAAGKDVVVVVSAMGDTTDDLLALAKQVSESPARRELDMLLSAGERISMALLSMALNARGVPAVSFTGSQSGIVTNDAHTNARIVEVRPFRVQDELERGKVVIVAGYQGVSYRRDVTTLGRGGSDTTAVALAAALDAEACEIYSDVEGVYTADPRVVPNARRLSELSYEEMQELAESGAKVLNAQAVEFAKDRGIAIYARATRGGAETVIRKLPPRAPGRVVGVASETGLVVVTTTAGPRSTLVALLDRLERRQVGGKQLLFQEWPKIGGSCSLVLDLENLHEYAALRRELTGLKLGVSVLLFLFLFKLGEAFLGRMAIVFYKEVGFTDTQIAQYSKLLTAAVTIVFSMAGGLLNARIGIIKGLFVGGIAMAASNLMFAWIAIVGPNEKLYAATIFVDGFTSAMSTVAFVAFISYFTSHTYTGTQYALLAAVGTLGRTFVSGASGFVVDALSGNWAIFFVITALMVIPSLILLVYVGRLLRERIKHWEAEA